MVVGRLSKTKALVSTFELVLTLDFGLWTLDQILFSASLRCNFLVLICESSCLICGFLNLDNSKNHIIIKLLDRGRSADGSASDWQSGGHGFESRRLQSMKWRATFL